MKKRNFDDFDGRSWQLYRDPEADAVAMSLNENLSRLLDIADRNIIDGSTPIKEAVAVRDEMYKIMNDFVKLGARDTEPEFIMVVQIEKELGLVKNSLPRFGLPITVPSQELIASLVITSQAAHRAARLAKKNLDAILVQALRGMMPVGSLIDLRDRKQLPDHLLHVRTIQGNDRGTKIFRIEKICSVDSDPECLFASKWTCETTPISESTGKDMSGKPGNKKSSTSAILLTGEFGGERMIDEPFDQIDQRIYKAIVKALAIQ